MNCTCTVGNNLFIMQVNILVQQWALEQWEEDKQVSL